MRLLLSIPLISLTILATAASAQEATETRDETIVVTATRTEQPVELTGRSITVFDTETLRERQTQTVVDVLRTAPGVTISRSGGVGSAATVFIRGANSDQTVALIDGVKLADPSLPGGGFNFGNLLVGNIARVELLRGPSSVLWGSQAIGGVVNVVTTVPTERLTVNARGEYGFRDTAQAVANISGTAGPLAGSIGGGYFRSDGISAFNAARGGRERDGYRNVGANGSLRLTLSDALSIDARGYYSDGRVGFDGFAPPTFSLGDTPDYDTTRELVGYGGVNAALFEGRWRNRLGFAITDTRRRTFDGVGGETFFGQGRNERLEYQGVVDFTMDMQATFGVERETSRFTTTGFGSTTRGRARLDSVYAQLVASPVNGLSLTGGARHDEHDRFGGETTFGGSGSYSPNDGATTLRASYSEGFKAPSLFQLQSDFGNQQLRPERADGYDAGVTQRLLNRQIEIGATYFRRISRDLIDFISCPAPRTGICTGRPFGTYDNVARARAEGVEVAIALQPTEALNFTANYSYIDARNRSVGNVNFGRRLARRPEQTVNATIDYRWRFGLSAGATVTHVGTSFDDAANARRLQSYVLADIRAAFPLTERVEVYGRVENLFEERYETVFNYGSAGRAAYGGVRLRY